MATLNDQSADPKSAREAREALVLDQAVLQALAPKMQAAVECRADGQDDKAEALLRAILKDEPRLAEPRLELAHIAAIREDWEEAQAQARVAVVALRGGGQWTLDVEPEGLLSFALNLLGEVLVRPLEGSDLFLVDQDAFKRVWNEAATLFAEAKKVDVSNEDARRNVARYRPL